MFMNRRRNLCVQSSWNLFPRRFVLTTLKTVTKQHEGQKVLEANVFLMVDGYGG